MRKIGYLLWKDALSELRSLERLVTLALFSAVVLTTLHFSLPPGSDIRPRVAAGFLWASILFSAMLELRRSFESERRDGTLDGLRAAPLHPSTLFVAKTLSSLTVIGLMILVLVPMTSLLFAGGTNGILPAIAVALAGCVGLVCWGTLFAAVAGGSRAGEIVLPVLLFPILVPQTIACVRLLTALLSGDATTGTGLLLLGAFDLLALGTSLLLFDYVLDE